VLQAKNTRSKARYLIICITIDSTEVTPLLFPIPTIAAASGYFTFSAMAQDEFMRSAFMYMMFTRFHKHSDSHTHKISAMHSKQKALVRLQQLVSPTGAERLRREHCFAIGILLWAEVCP
jgi:hypothetical protein